MSPIEDVKKKKLSASDIYKKYGLFIILVLMIIIMAFAHENFLSISNFKNIFRQMSMNGLLVVGMACVLTTGGIDLSVGAIVGLSGVVAAFIAQNHTNSVFLAIAAGCFVGFLVGSISGILVARLNIPAFISTLGMQSIARGAVMLLCEGRPVSGLSDQFLGLAKNELFGIPIPTVILFIAFVLASIMLYRMRFGRYVYAIGGNRDAAIVSGLRVRTVEWSVYAISGFLAGISGVILASRVGSGMPKNGEGYELDAIAASVIGGVSLAGGEGRLWGAMIGVIILAVIQNGLDLMTINSNMQMVVKGCLTIVAVFVDRMTKRVKT